MTLEVARELSLVYEAGMRGDLGQREVSTPRSVSESFDRFADFRRFLRMIGTALA